MTPTPIPPVIDSPQVGRLKYSITRGDVLRWYFYLFLHNRVLILFISVVGLFLAWNDLRRPEFAAYSIAAKTLYALFFIAINLCFVGFATMMTMWLTIMFKKLQGLLGEHELEIRDDGIVERTNINESVHRWAGFHKIITTRRYLYIYVTDHNVHIVPRRSFASEQEEKAFRNEIEKHARSNKETASKTSGRDFNP